MKLQLTVNSGEVTFRLILFCPLQNKICLMYMYLVIIDKWDVIILHRKLLKQ